MFFIETQPHEDIIIIDKLINCEFVIMLLKLWSLD